MERDCSSFFVHDSCTGFEKNFRMVDVREILPQNRYRSFRALHHRLLLPPPNRFRIRGTARNRTRLCHTLDTSLRLSPGLDERMALVFFRLIVADQFARDAQERVRAPRGTPQSVNVAGGHPAISDARPGVFALPGDVMTFWTHSPTKQLAPPHHPPH